MFVLLAGCTAARQRPEAGLPSQRAHERDLAELQSAQEQNQQTIRELEARLALAGGEIAGLRAESYARLPETPSAAVRIGSPTRGASAEPEEWDETWSEPPSQGPRPLLRLYENVDAPPLIIPRAPAGTPLGLGVAPLPETGSTHHPASGPAQFTPQGSGERRPPDVGAAEYRQALALVRGRNFSQALPAFQAFLEHHPEHPYVSNAVYWTGEIHYAQRSYDRAAAVFGRVVSRHPTSGKVPDSLFKIGLCHLRMGDAARARIFFERVQQRYPDSVAARLASQEDAS